MKYAAVRGINKILILSAYSIIFYIMYVIICYNVNVLS